MDRFDRMARRLFKLYPEIAGFMLHAPDQPEDDGYEYHRIGPKPEDEPLDRYDLQISMTVAVTEDYEVTVAEAVGEALHAELTLSRDQYAQARALCNRVFAAVLQ